jgi:hypothetical protein
MTYKHKYVCPLKHPLDAERRGGVKPRKELWTGDALILRDRDYAFLKHRAQAKFRCEDYSLTLEQWQELWPIDTWLQRGRTPDSLCIIQLEAGGGWHWDNVVIAPRIEYLRRNREYRARR